MSETAATCPTLRRALEKIRTLTGHGCYDCMMAEPSRCPRCAEIDETVDTALAAPAPDPLTALEREVAQATIALEEAKGAWEEDLVHISRCQNRYDKAVDAYIAARTAARQEPSQ